MAAYLDRAGGAVSCVSAAFLASFIATGALTRHQARAMRTYSARQARFVAACRELIPGVRALGIEAGLHVVLAFDPGGPGGGPGEGTGRRGRGGPAGRAGPGLRAAVALLR